MKIKSHRKPPGVGRGWGKDRLNKLKRKHKEKDREILEEAERNLVFPVSKSSVY